MNNQKLWTKRTIFYLSCLAVLLVIFLFLPWFTIQVPVLGISFSHSAAVWPFKISDMSSSINQMMQSVASSSDSDLTEVLQVFQVYTWTWYAMLAMILVAVILRFAADNEDRFVTWSIVALAVCAVSALILIVLRAALLAAVHSAIQQELNSTSSYTYGLSSSYGSTVDSLLKSMFKIGPGAWLMLVGSVGVIIFTIAARASAKPGTTLWALVKGEGASVQRVRPMPHQQPAGNARPVSQSGRPTAYVPGLMLIGPNRLWIVRFPHTVGSDSSCDTVIDSPEVAPRQCAFKTAGARIVIEAFEGSTQLDGETLPLNRSFQLFDDDTITIGSTVYQVKIFNAANMASRQS